MALKDWAALILLSVLWGGSFFFIEVAVTSLPTLTIVTLRVAIAAVILLLVLHTRGLPLPLNRTTLSAFTVMAVLNNVIPFSLIVWGQSQIASGLAAILNASTPLFALVVAHFLTSDEKLTGRKAMGTLIGFVGVVVIMGPEALSGLGGALLAQAAILVAACSYAFAGVYGRRFKALNVSPMATAAGMLSASAIVLLPITIWLERPHELPMPEPSVLLAILALAGISTAYAYILYFKILERAGAANLLLVTMLVPASAILLGVSFLGETLSPVQGIGLASIIAGLLLIDGRVLKKSAS